MGEMDFSQMKVLLTPMGLIRKATTSSVALNHQIIIVETIKRILMAPSLCSLSHMYQIQHCLSQSLLVIQSGIQQGPQLKDEATLRSLKALKDQIDQLSATFKMKIKATEKSSQQFRMQFVLTRPTLLGNMNDLQSASFSFDPSSVCAYNSDLRQLVELMTIEVSSDFHRNGMTSPKQKYSSPDNIILDEAVILNIMLQYCRDSMKVKNVPGIIIGDVTENVPSLTDERNITINLFSSVELCGIMIGYLIDNDSRTLNQHSMISSVIFQLGSNLTKKIRNTNFEDIVDEEISSLVVELIFTISIISSLYFRRKLHDSIGNNDDMTFDVGTGSDHFCVLECHELLSWLLSICCAVRAIPNHKLKNPYNLKNGDSQLENEQKSCETEIVKNVMDNNLLKFGDGNSIIQSSLFQYFIRPLFYENYDASILLTFSRYCSDYLNSDMKNGFQATNKNENRKILLNSTDAFSREVDHVFFSFNSAHRTAIIAFTEYCSSPKLFFSVYGLQSCFIKSLCKIVENRTEVYEIVDSGRNMYERENLRESDGNSLNNSYIDSHSNTLSNNNSCGDSSNSIHDSINTALIINSNGTKNAHNNNDDITVDHDKEKYTQQYPNSFQTSDPSRIKKNTDQAVSIGNAYTIVSTAARIILRTESELFLRILCDSVSCSISLEVEKAKKIKKVRNISVSKNDCTFLGQNMEIEKKSGNAREYSEEVSINAGHSSIEHSSEEHSSDSTCELNIVEPIINFLFAVTQDIGISTSDLLLSMIKPLNYHPHPHTETNSLPFNPKNDPENPKPQSFDPQNPDPKIFDLKNFDPKKPDPKSAPERSDPHNPEVFSSIENISREYGGGFLISATILLSVTDVNRSEEVHKLMKNM